MNNKSANDSFYKIKKAKLSGDLSCNVSIIQEKLGNKKIYTAKCEELGISDFGDTIEDALSNLKIGLNLLLENDPEKLSILEEKTPLLVTRMLL